MTSFLRSKFAFVGITLGSICVFQAAHAADVYFSVGVPVTQAPVYVAQPAPVYVPQPVYEQPAPRMYVAPVYGGAYDWQRQREWREMQWRRHEWQERQRWREWHRWHDDD